ncbi:MAG: hypothetical protein P8Y37_11150 [Anaerolineales bacterium]
MINPKQLVDKQSGRVLIVKDREVRVLIAQYKKNPNPLQTG